MRQSIRAATREGFDRIAVVCGAWHAPVLHTMGPPKNDVATLKGLPKTKVSATWVPWTMSRLTHWSGYGAGIESPGYYQHPVSYTHLRAHETPEHLVCRLLLEKKKIVITVFAL